MPVYHRFFEAGHLQFITTSTYRRLVAAPGDWPWSSWRFYYLRDASRLEIDRLGDSRVQ